MNMKQLKKQLILNIPYIVMGLAATNLGEMWRLAVGANASEKVQSIVLDYHEQQTKDSKIRQK